MEEMTFIRTEVVYNPDTKTHETQPTSEPMTIHELWDIDSTFMDSVEVCHESLEEMAIDDSLALTDSTGYSYILSRIS
jgi:hypothetical protein